MFRRSVLELSSRQALRRNNTRVTTQLPSYLHLRKQYSVTPEKNIGQPSGSAGKPPESGNSSRIALIGGGLVLGAAVLTAYKFDELLPFLRSNAPESAKIGTKDPVDFSRKTQDFQEEKSLGEKYVISSNEVSDASVPSGEPGETNIETHSDISPVDASGESERDNQFQGAVSTELSPDLRPVQEKELSTSEESVLSDLQSSALEASHDEKNDTKRSELDSSIGQHEVAQTKTIPEESSTTSTEPHQKNATDNLEVSSGLNVERPSSLLDKYHLRDEVQSSIPTKSEKLTDSVNATQPSIPNITETQRDSVNATQESDDNYISKDRKLVLDFLEAIHAAEKRQAELDAHIFAEEKRKMKEKYEKELKDARARELMYAEEAAIRDKELKRERVKAAAAVKSVQEELEEKLKIELEQKEAEAETNLKKIQELAKAELAAAIASEKASQIEKMAEANLHINALCMAFYARSEEARQSHSVHKLALGALALEDALSKGLPIQKEIDALHTYLEGIDKDPLLNLVLSSLPEDTRSSGSDTMLQLRQKFDGLKPTVRHFSLIPPQGGGILTHSLAHVASWLKVTESDQSGDGIESLLNRVESFLADGKLSEAAETLENGVKGTQAEEVTGDWLKRVRNRAVTEQALTLIQAYATSISLT